MPVFQGNTVIGAVNFGYGEPPKGAQALSQLAERYGVAEGVLAKLAAEHRPVASEVVDEVKRRLATAARLIGELVERTEAERKRVELQERLRRSEKLESLGVLAGGVAHDFNNLLVGVLSNAELLAEQLQGNQRGQAESIVQAALLARRLCSQMLTYAGRTRAERQPIDLGALLHENLEIVRAALGGRFRLRADASPDVPCVLGDSAGLQQIVMNLAINAAEATGESGTVWIRTGVTTLGTEPDGFILLGDLEPGRHAYLEVEDHGSGIPPEDIERICEPFYSSKATGRGLGMASVLGIVRSHGGVVGIQSVLGRGTRIRILLPPTENVPGGASVERPNKALHETAGKPTVLVVDDEDLVRRTCAVVLHKYGYRAVGCASGEQALDTFDADPSRFAAALVDRTMPAMAGTELVEALRMRRRDLPVVLMSGYSGQDHQPLDVQYLSKPFRAQELLSSLREALGRNDK